MIELDNYKPTRASPLDSLVKSYQAPKSKRTVTDRDNEDDLNATKHLVHPMWESLDPTPDVHSLFGAFNSKFFQSRLHCVELEWSKRMYSCAGICYSRRNRMGQQVTIRLSEPLLKLRSRKDLVETLLVRFFVFIFYYIFVLSYELQISDENGKNIVFVFLLYVRQRMRMEKFNRKLQLLFLETLNYILNQLVIYLSVTYRKPFHATKSIFF